MFYMCGDARRSVNEMNGNLTEMKKRMEELRITSKTLNTLPGMEESITNRNEVIRLLEEIHNVMTVMA